MRPKLLVEAVLYAIAEQRYGRRRAMRLGLEFDPRHGLTLTHG